MPIASIILGFYGENNRNKFKLVSLQARHFGSFLARNSAHRFLCRMAGPAKTAPGAAESLIDTDKALVENQLPLT
jgi:hypothetical protein